MITRATDNAADSTKELHRRQCHQQYFVSTATVGITGDCPGNGPTYDLVDVYAMKVVPI